MAAAAAVAPIEKPSEPTSVLDISGRTELLFRPTVVEITALDVH